MPRRQASALSGVLVLLFVFLLHPRAAVLGARAPASFSGVFRAVQSAFNRGSDSSDDDPPRSEPPAFTLALGNVSLLVGAPPCEGAADACTPKARLEGFGANNRWLNYHAEFVAEARARRECVRAGIKKRERRVGRPS